MLTHPRARLTLRPAALALALALAAFAPPAGATDIALTFGSLPSAQGWTFASGGSPLATEAQAFSLGSGFLDLNTMAFTTTGSGTAAYYTRPGVLNTIEPVVIRMRGRLVQHEGDFTNTFVGGGFAFGFSQGTTAFQMGITPTQIRNIGGTILSTAYDNTQFHDYRIEWDPPSTLRYYVDDHLISTSPAGLGQALNRIFLGDVTGAANAHAEITDYRFFQGLPTPARSGSWGGLKSRYR